MIMNRKKYQSLCCLFSAVLLLSSCGFIKIKEENEVTPAPTSTPVQETEVIEPTASNLNPLTGEPESNDISAERPYAVMINNIVYAQPQIGISHADWIYEMEAEGGITRMMALFSHIQDVPSIGSVRSLRPYYLSLALSYDAIMVHAGGSPEAYSDCESLYADHIDGVRDPSAYSFAYYRDTSRGAHGSEHTLFLYGDKIPSYADQVGMRRTHNEGYSNDLSFSVDSAVLCPNDAANVQITVTKSKTTSFTYHPESGKYTGYQHGGDYIDGATNEAVAFSNILVLQAEMRTYDSYGRMAAEIIGSGTGWFCTGGKWAAINWSRADLNSPYSYTTQDGTPITFTPGKTYCAIVSPQTGGVNFS